MRRVGRSGPYFRVCKPDWTDCADTSFSRTVGGRWNAPGEHEVLYLNRTEHTAALQALENFRGEAHSLFDLRPERRPHLQTFHVAEAEFVDAIEDAGLEALGLGADYPAGFAERWEECREIGRRAFAAGERGIACRSACRGARRADEELALFVRDARPPASAGERREFARWFPTGEL